MGRHTADEFPPYSAGIEAIIRARLRQFTKGYTPEHDRRHTVEDLLDAAKAYLASVTPHAYASDPMAYWPWPSDGFNPGTREEALAKAGAMIAAALDRIAIAEARAEEG